MRISFTVIVVALCAAFVGIAPALAEIEDGGVAASDAACPFPLTRQNRPVAPPFAPAETATFVDPTVVVQGAENVRVSQQDYIAPFARLIAEGDGDDDDGGHRGGICIEESSNVQDMRSTLSVSVAAKLEGGASGPPSSDVEDATPYP